jgi:hypothetical protein
MSEQIESVEELEDCCNEYTQSEYEGLFGCQTNELPSFFRSRFRTKQYRTRKVKWDEIKSQYNNFHPTILCDPCATPEAMSFSDAFFRHDVTPIHLASLITIDCGEVDDCLNEPQPGVMCAENEITDPDVLFRRLLGQRALMQSSGYDDIEECLALEFMMTQGIDLPKSDYLPMGGKLSFPRDEELNCVTQEMFGKGQCDAKGVLRRWMNKIDCVEGFMGLTDVYMHCDTWEDFLNSDDMRDCLKSYNLPTLLEAGLINQMTREPLIRTKGVTQVWTSPEGIRFWKVNLKKRYCTEDGTFEKYDVMPKNKLIGFDFSGGPCSYAPVWGYVPIVDIARQPSGSIVTNVSATSRYVKTKVSWHPAGFKQIMMSNMMPFLPYRNSSSELCLGVAKDNEVFKLKTDVVPAEVREANADAALIEAHKKELEDKKLADAAADIRKQKEAEAAEAAKRAEAERKKREDEAKKSGGK